MSSTLQTHLWETIDSCLVGLVGPEVEQQLRRVFPASFYAVYSSLTDSDSLSAVDSYIDACEILAEAVAEKLRSYKKRHNALIPLHRLPIEVFNQILDKHAKKEDIQGRKYHRNLMPLRLVSTEWRSAVDGARQLWSYVYLTHRVQRQPDAVNFVLNKSYPAPLDIVLPYQQGLPMKRLRPIIRHSSRWRSLEANLCTKGPFERLLSYPTPNLKKLEVNIQSWAVLNDPVFAGTLPQLKELDLRGVALPRWDAPFLTGLESLTLSNMRFLPATLSSCLRAILSTCTALVKLRITSTEWMNDKTNYLFGVEDQIVLPALQNVTFECVRSSTILWFLSFVNAPRIKRLHLYPSNLPSIEALMQFAHTVAPWLDALSPNLEDEKLVCCIETSAAKFTIGSEVDLNISLRHIDIPSIADTSAQLCRLISSRFPTIETSLRVSLMTVAEDIDTLRALDGCFATITNLTIREVYPSSGRRIVPESIQVLGSPSGVSGRWLYAQVTSLTLILGASMDEALKVVRELFRRRYTQPTPELAAPARISELTVGGLDFPDKDLVDLAESFPGVFVRRGPRRAKNGTDDYTDSGTGLNDDDDEDEDDEDTASYHHESDGESGDTDNEWDD